MVQYIHPPKQALWDRAGENRDGDARYKNKLGDNIIDVPNDQGWQSGDIHMAMDGHDRMQFSHMYKAEGGVQKLAGVKGVKRVAVAKHQTFEAKQAKLRRSLRVMGGKAAHDDVHKLFLKTRAVVAKPKEVKKVCFSCLLYMPIVLYHFEKGIAPP